MAAIRYSGNVRARVSLIDDNLPDNFAQYRVVARILEGSDKGRAFVELVGLKVEHGRGYGTDAPRAFDEAAKIGLRFLANGHDEVRDALTYDPIVDVVVTRRPTSPALLIIEHDSGAPHGHL